MEETPRAYDYVGKSKEELSWFEKATRYIPGYRGYAKKEKIRATDALIRSQASDALYSSRNDLAEAFDSMSATDAALAGALDKLTVRIDTLTQRVKHAAQGYTSLFDPIKVREDELERLVSFDVQLIEMATEMSKETAEIKKGSRTGDVKREAIDSLYDSIDRFEAVFSGRDEHMLGLPR